MALKIKVLKAPEKDGNCGGVEYQVRWVLDAGDTGWVIQRIDWDHDVLKCDDNADAELSGRKDCAKRDIPQFWEAWRVEAGKVFIGRSASEHGSDTFRFTNHPSRKKEHSAAGKVQFVANYNLTIGTGADDWQENEIGPAGALPTRTSEPTGWSAAQARDHNLKVEWDCCADPPEEPTITGDPIESDPGTGETIPKSVEYVVSRSARRVAKLLVSAPSWVTLRGDEKATDRLVRQLEKVSAYHTDVVRGGVELFIQQASRESSYTLDEQSKLYLLNRYLFQLPRYAGRGQFPVFGGWLVPGEGKRFNPNWPFSIQKGGELALKGEFSGYMGDEFQAIPEFDCFKTCYRRRKPAKKG